MSIEMTNAMRLGIHRKGPEPCWCTCGKVSARCKIHSQQQSILDVSPGLHCNQCGRIPIFDMENCGCGGVFRALEGPIAAPGAAASGPVTPNPTESPNDHNSDRPVPNSQPQCDQAPALGGAVQGKETGVSRVTVRFTGYRVRPLDPDNFAGSVKDLLDGLRHAGLIVGDEPWRIILETEQVKVASFKEEKTVIEITTA